MLVFVAGPLVAAVVYLGGLKALEARLAKPERAPVVAALGGFGLLSFVVAIQSMVWLWHARKWPVARGRIVAADVKAFEDWQNDRGKYDRMITLYAPGVVYSYEVGGVRYLGDRLTLGTRLSSSVPGVAKQMLVRYPVGLEVRVHHHAKNPGDSVLHLVSVWNFIPWLATAAGFGLAWVIGTGRLG
jgi:hypothetical protein